MKPLKTLKDVLNAENLGTYFAAQIISAQTDDPIDYLQKEIAYHLDPDTANKESLTKILDALGYEIRYVKKEE